MNFDSLGKRLTTNHITITSDEVEKKYRDFSPTMLWAWLERKERASAGQRYFREKAACQMLYPKGLNVPEILAHDDQRHVLKWRTLELKLTDLVSVLGDPSTHLDDKLVDYRAALELLQGIHRYMPHGDAYLKNFFKPTADNGRGRIYTCDFEETRNSPEPGVTDLLIITANAMSRIGGAHPGQACSALDVVRQVYGNGTSFPFDARDRFFFRARFGMGEDFFRYFSQNGR